LHYFIGSLKGDKMVHESGRRSPFRVRGTRQPSGSIPLGIPENGWILRAAGFWLGNLHAKATIETFPPSHEPLPLSKPAGAHRWRFMEKWFSGRGFVAARDARRCSGFARSATAGSATAARLVAAKPCSGNTARPTAGTSRVQRAGSIIATGNAPTGSVMRPA